MMALDGFGTRFDEQLVRARLLSVTFRPGLAGWIVADRKAEEVEPYASVDGVQSVTDPRLARFELQSDAAQPLPGNLPRSLDSSTRGVQHHEVIRIDHHMWTVVLAEGGGDSSLQTMQGDEREQR